MGCVADLGIERGPTPANSIKLTGPGFRPTSLHCRSDDSTPDPRADNLCGREPRSGAAERASSLLWWAGALRL